MGNNKSIIKNEKACAYAMRLPSIHLNNNIYSPTLPKQSILDIVLWSECFLGGGIAGRNGTVDSLARSLFQVVMSDTPVKWPLESLHKWCSATIAANGTSLFVVLCGMVVDNRLI